VPGWSIQCGPKPHDHWFVPAENTSAPLAAVYLTADVTPGWPGRSARPGRAGV
jgi:hypothetical protein